MQSAAIYAIITLALKKRADVAQSVERILGKDEVTGSNPVISSIKQSEKTAFSFVYAPFLHN